MERKSLFVQCLPTQQDKQGSFHQHQMAVKKDLERKLQQRGVPVVTDFKTDPASEVFVLFQSVGRVGDELPCALQDLPQDTRERVTAFAVIQDDEYHKVGREVLPSDFQPQHFLDFVVVPGTSRLKDCAANNAVLDQIAQHAGGVPCVPEMEDERGATAEGKTVFVQCLPTQQDKQGSFHQHQMAVKEDLERKLQQRGVPVVTDFKTDPASEVFVLFQSVGRVGDELPCALQDLPQDTRGRVTAFAVIQDDEYHKVGREVLPPDFQPHLLDFVVVPGTSRLKDCAANNAVLDQIAQHAGGVPCVPEMEDERGATAEEKTVFVQCLSRQRKEQEEAVKEHLVQELQRRGVTVVAEFKDTDPALEVLVLFQPVDRNEGATQDLPPNIRKKVTAFAVIQNDEHQKVGREDLPPDFKPQHLLNFVVDPDKHGLKNCDANKEVLDQIAKYAGGVTEIEEKSRIIGFVQCLPTQQDKQGSFHQHQMAVKEDLELKLRQRGVTVENEFKDTDPTLEVLVLFQSVGRVGDELPSALQDLPPNIKGKVEGFAVIQDDEHHKVGREVLPPDFQPHLLDFVVVPGTSRLKDCAANNEVLDQIAQYTGAAVAKVEATSSLGGLGESAQSLPTDTNQEEPSGCTLL